MPSLNTPPTQDGPLRGRAYWRSLDEMSETVEFREWMHREFPSGASEMLDGGDRRHFLRIMGASFALAGLGLAGCRRWPREEIVPATLGEPDRIASVPVEYASVLEQRGVGLGVLVRSYEGRPIKIEGNPDHPGSLGASDVFMQASILDLYDPDRSTGVLRGGAESDWTAFRRFATQRGTALGTGAGLRVLCEATASPSVTLMRQRLTQRFPNLTWHEYESVNNDETIRGAKLAFGDGRWRRELRLADADVIVALDADLFGGEPDALTSIRGWADRRRYSSPDDVPTRMYSVEPELSLTGAKADERMPMRANDVAVAVSYLAGKILGDEAGRLGQAKADRLSAATRTMLDHAAADLQSHRGRGVVVAGRTQPAEVHYLCHLLNQTLENMGATVIMRRTPAAPIEHAGSIAALAAAMDAGSVDTLLILGGNPAYDAPSDLDFEAKLGSVKHVVHCSQAVDETSAAAEWHVNRAHALESWGDALGWDGTYSIQQPLIVPLFDGHTPAEVLATFAGVDVDGQGIAKLAFTERLGTTEESAWRTALQNGVAGDAAAAGSPSVAAGRLGEAISTLESRWTANVGGAFELVFRPHPTVGDGRWANNGWLQECPDPLSKLTWDNAAIISPKTARELNLKDGDHITITAGSQSIETPIIRIPGTDDASVILHLGFGRRMQGRVCAGVGVDVGPLRSAGAMSFRGGATVAKASGTTKMATTQDHHTIDVASTFAGGQLPDRLDTIVRGADWNEYKEDPAFAAHRVHVPSRLSMFDPPKLDGMYRWGMSIDLNACVGCNACITACQAENNIPIVGKEQVTRGREMHWIRLDRYFSFATKADGAPDPDSLAGVAYQPMMCVHCENAPCEQVCPVAATVHDHDGLNVMVYNRCIGTRYCSNNCPYKVRRFNYLDYHRRDPLRDRQVLEVQPDYYMRRQSGADELKQMQFNPEVTVRMRGVMEKCTYCSQRIAKARIEAKNAWARDRSKAARDLLAAEGLENARRQAVSEERVPVADGAIQTACEQACPANAITFGDLRDETSRVSAGHRNPRSYELLEELHVKPRTRYLATVMNPYGGGEAGHGSHGPAADHADDGHADSAHDATDH